jgi:hypothetical protein
MASGAALTIPLILVLLPAVLEALNQLPRQQHGTDIMRCCFYFCAERVAAAAAAAAVLKALNQLPRQQHGTDIMRVRHCLSC